MVEVGLTGLNRGGLTATMYEFVSFFGAILWASGIETDEDRPVLRGIIVCVGFHFL